MTDVFIYIYIIFVILLCTDCLKLFIARLARFHYYRNLLKASEEFKIPAKKEGNVRTGWQQGYYRDTRGSRLVLCRVRLFKQGILVREPFSNSVFLLPRPNCGTVYIPARSLKNARAFSLGWYMRLFVREDWTELDVAGHDFSLVIPTDLYDQLT